MKISVITANYNMFAGLKETVESVQKQTYDSIEHIVIDGSSNDGSAEYFRAIKKASDQLVSEPDEGIADAFNKGGILATGDFVIFMNSGDVFVDHEVIESFVASVVCKRSIYYGDFLGKLEGREFLVRASADLNDFQWFNPLNHQSVFIPTQVVKNYQYDQRLLLGMDYDFWLRVRHSVDFIKLGFPIAIFGLNGRSCDESWRIHNIAIRRFLWFINNNVKIQYSDMFELFMFLTKSKIKLIFKSILK